MSVLLKVPISPALFGRLDEALRGQDGPLKVEVLGEELEPIKVGFCDLVPGSRNFDGYKIEVAIKIEEEVWTWEGLGEGAQSGGPKPVPRSAFIRLIDFLGLYSRDGKLPEEIAEPLKQIGEALQALYKVPEVDGASAQIRAAHKRLEARLLQLL